MRNRPGMNVLLALLLLPQVAFADPSPHRALIHDGHLVRAVADGATWRLERIDRSPAVVASHALPAAPDFLQAGAAAAVAGDLRAGHDRWAVVAGAAGTAWQVAGEPVRVHLSRGGDRVLVQGPSEGRQRTRVYTAQGLLVADLPVAASADRSTSLSLAGDAVLVAPTGDAPAEDLTVIDLETQEVRSLRYPEGDLIEHALALDARRVLTLGGGTLRLRSLAGGGPEWGLHPPGGYWTLLGVSDDGARILVSRTGGWDVLDGAGEVVFRLGHGAGTLRAALGPEAPRGLQPRLLAGGDLLLAETHSEPLDQGGERRWIVRLDGNAGAARVVPLPEGALVDPHGRWMLPPGAQRAISLD
ncbi:MAG TPA: hypothetical protein VHQ65_02330 [Thermoanaerobaculia bacterium]|nr:hypothetical protein [Thermoanaerobaculia bacterium]